MVFDIYWTDILLVWMRSTKVRRGEGIGKLDRSVARAWEVTPKWEVRPKCFARKENN